MTLIKSISGIRGTIGGVPGDNLTPIDIVKFATAYVRFLSEKGSGRRLTVVVGRDARISGAMVDDLIEGTLLGCGVDVINVGLCTTPGTEMAVIANNADGGIIITASHNPRQWNALKLLDERGEEMRSVEFAYWMQKRMNSGVKRMVLVIGGPYGFSDEVYARADARLSLSRMTFSHQIVRAIFAEQIYRAFTILNNEPYHHE